jgi:hypothetical protein
LRTLPIACSGVSFHRPAPAKTSSITAADPRAFSRRLLPRACGRPGGFDPRDTTIALLDDILAARPDLSHTPAMLFTGDRPARHARRCARRGPPNARVYDCRADIDNAM